MTSRILLVCTLIFVQLFSYGQDQTVQWINKNSHSLEDLSFLDNELKDKRIVALGEASHGTHEFYQHKARIIQHLVTKLGYKTIGFEFPGKALEPVNEYILNGTGNLKKLMEPFALYNTQEIYTMFEWLRDYNKSQEPSNKVVAFGFDDPDFIYVPLERDKFMAENIVTYMKSRSGKAILWAHNQHLAKDTTMTRFEATGAYLKKEYDTTYYVVCFDTYRGTVNTISNGVFEKHEFTASESSFSKLFSTSKYDSFYLNFSKGSPLVGKRDFIVNIYSSWESSWQKERALPIKPGIDFDAVIFIEETTASKKLE